MADVETTVKKPRAKKTNPASAQLADLPERVGVVEAKLEYTNEKLDDLKVDVREMHDCLDRTRDVLDEKLDHMLVEYRTNRDRFYEHMEKLHADNTSQHATLMGKVTELEKFKSKWTLYAMLGLAFIAGSGWLGHIDIKTIAKFAGL